MYILYLEVGFIGLDLDDSSTARMSSIPRNDALFISLTSEGCTLSMLGIILAIVVLPQPKSPLRSITFGMVFPVSFFVRAVSIFSFPIISSNDFGLCLL